MPAPQRGLSDLCTVYCLHSDLPTPPPRGGTHTILEDVTQDGKSRSPEIAAKHRNNKLSPYVLGQPRRGTGHDSRNSGKSPSERKAEEFHLFTPPPWRHHGQCVGQGRAPQQAGPVVADRDHPAPARRTATMRVSAGCAVTRSSSFAHSPCPPARPVIAPRAGMRRVSAATSAAYGLPGRPTTSRRSGGRASSCG